MALPVAAVGMQPDPSDCGNLFEDQRLEQATDFSAQDPSSRAIQSSEAPLAGRHNLRVSTQLYCTNIRSGRRILGSRASRLRVGAGLRSVLKSTSVIRIRAGRAPGPKRR